MVDKTTLAVTGQCSVALLEAIGKTKIRDFYRNEATGIGYYAPSPDGVTADLRSIQASLPSLLWGHNGRLLTTEEEILRALEEMVRRAGNETGLALGNARRLPVKAIELACHVKIDINKVIMTHWHKRHPLVRNKTVCHQDETICFPGTNLKISFYDKPREMGLPSEFFHKITRPEITFRNKEIINRLGTRFPFAEVGFLNLLYQAYRQILTGFSTSDVPQAGSIVSLLALLEHRGHKDGDISYFDLWAKDKTLDHRRRVRKKIAAALDALVHFQQVENTQGSLSWSTIFPESVPPQAIHLEPYAVVQSNL